MAKIIISLGSNIRQEYHIEKAKSLLASVFEDMVFTNSIWTEPVGIVCSDALFLNALGCASTDWSVDMVDKALKQVERQCGRKCGEKEQGIIRMDVDILLYDDVRYHEKDWQRNYVSQLLKELD